MSSVTSSPLVSVIIPNYNKSSLIFKCIQSVLDQSYQDFEIIFVDNNSSDDSISVLSKFSDKRIKLIEFNNRGIIACSRNIGVSHSKGEYLAFLDSDDFWDRDKLLESIRTLNYGADLTYHDFYIYSNNIQNKKRVMTSRLLENPIFDDLLAKGNALINSSVVVKRDLFVSIDCFSEDPDLVGMEDFDAWLRYSRISEEFVYIPKPLGYLFVGSSNTSNSANLNFKSSKRILSLYKQEILGLKNVPNHLYYKCLSSAFKIGLYRISINNFFKLDLFRLSPLILFRSILILIISFFLSFISFFFDKFDD